MKTGSIRREFVSILCALVGAGAASAQVGPVFGPLQRLTNREVMLRLSASNGVNYRIDASTNLPASEWDRLVTVAATGTNLQHTDSGAPFIRERYYRAEQLPSGTNVFTGDHLATTNGDVIIHPLYHASFVMSWNGKIIYNDPDDDAQFASRYQGMPKADLILISHEHGDHYSVGQINAVRGSNAVIIVPQQVYNRSDFAALRSIAIPLAYGVSTNVIGLSVQAVPGYNGNHAFGNNNGYIITIGGKRIFTSGDSGNTAEFRAMTNIDVAFLCMNLPFTMSASDATNCVRAFRPKVVYPYHYREGTSNTNNSSTFKNLLGTDLGIEVRLRSWY